MLSLHTRYFSYQILLLRVTAKHQTVPIKMSQAVTWRRLSFDWRRNSRGDLTCNIQYINVVQLGIYASNNMIFHFVVAVGAAVCPQ